MNIYIQDLEVMLMTVRGWRVNRSAAGALRMHTAGVNSSADEALIMCMAGAGIQFPTDLTFGVIAIGIDATANQTLYV